MAEVWSNLATPFANDSAVAAFDLWNEPHSVPVPPRLFGARFLLTFEASLMNHLAKTAPHQKLMTQQPLKCGQPTHVGRASYSRQIFSNHVFGTLLEPPWQTPHPKYASALRLLKDQAGEADGAPWVGEVGGPPGAASSAWIAKETNELDQFRPGCAYWDWNEGGSLAFIRNPSRLPMVPRAYPLVTPGVLTHFQYNYQTGVLKVALTERTTGSSLQIAVPSFFSSYRVVSSSDRRSDLSLGLNGTVDVLLVKIRDGLDQHSLAIKSSGEGGRIRQPQ